jgi:WD40 repeat protein
LLLLLSVNPAGSFGQTKPELVLQVGHTGGVSDVAFSPDGRWVATASSDRTAKLWDAITGRLVRTVADYPAGVSAVAFSPDGTLLVTASDKQLRFLTVETGREHRQLSNEESITSLSFHPRKPLLAVAGLHGRISILNTKSWAWERSFTEGVGMLLDVAFSPDGQWLASGTYYSEPSKNSSVVRIYHADGMMAGEPGHGLKHTLPQSGDVRVVAFRSDSKALVSVGEGVFQLTPFQRHLITLLTALGRDISGMPVTRSDPKIFLWDIAGGTLLKSIQAPEDIPSAAYSPVDDLVAMGGASGAMYFWRPNADIVPTKLRHTAKVDAVAFSPDGRFLASGVFNRRVGVWDVASRAPLRIMDGQDLAVGFVAFSPDERYLVSAGANRKGRVWEVASGRQLYTLAEEVSAPNAISFSPDGRTLLTGSREGAINVWDLASGSKKGSFHAHQGGVMSLAFSHNGRWLASGGLDNTVKVWDANNYSSVRNLKGHDHFVHLVKFSPDDKWLLSGSWDQTAFLWRTEGWERKQRLGPFLDLMFMATFTPDSRQLIFSDRVGTGEPQTVWAAPVSTWEDIYSQLKYQSLLRGMSTESVLKTWDVQGKRTLPPRVRGLSWLSAVTFNRDGSRIYTGGGDKAVRVWGAADGGAVKSYLGHSDAVTAIALSPKGKWLASGARDGSVRIWNDQSGQHSATLLSFNDGSWLAVTPDGLFDGAADAMRQVSWRIGDTNQVVPLDFFFNDFFHPELLAEIFGGGMPKATVDIATVLQLPGLRAMLAQGEASIEERDGKPVLCFREMPTAAPQVLADAQPLAFNVEDLLFYKDDAACRYRKVLPGGVQLELISTLSSGRAELPKPEYDREQSETAQSTLHVQVIGVGNYDATTSGLKVLPASVSGAKEVEKLFTEQKGIADKPYRDVRVWGGLYDSAATRDAIRRRLAEIAGEAGEEDVVLVFLSGHGMVPAGQEMFYFAPIDMQGPNPQKQRETGLNTAMLAEAVGQLRARRAVLIIDACQSGGALEALAKVAEVKVRVETGHAHRAGVYVIAAATPLQEAMQHATQGSSALGMTLLEALRGEGREGEGAVGMREVVRHVRRRLPEVSERAFNRRHTPMVVETGLDFPIAAARPSSQRR